MVEELIDILDGNGNKTGVSKTYKETHAKGLWHQTTHVWIYNSKGEILLQKRSMEMEGWPGLWDASVAGHISAGETSKQAALREIFEEIGIKANSKDIKQVMVRKASDRLKPNYYNNQFSHIYIFNLNKLPEKLQKEEVDAIEFIPISKFEEELKNPKTAKNFVPHEYIPELIKIIRKELAK
ncbi:MAG: NUDIX domain-containing protein [Candidatus Micrarchaeales archaeon]|jgi:isopentenyldiphosphate isomerase